MTGNYGNLTVNRDGTYTYTAFTDSGLAAGEKQEDHFTYILKDDSNEANIGTLRLGRPIFTPVDKNSIGKLSIEVVGVADANNAPDLKADTGYVYEDFTLTVADGASANDGLDSSPFTGDQEIAADSDFNSNHGDHTGDLLGNDVDDDGDTLSINGVRLASYVDTLADPPSFTTVSGSTSITGTYGVLTINPNGSYSYAATNTNTDELDLNDTVVDKFDYKATDGTDEAYTRLTITIKGINDDPVGVVNTDAVTLGSSLNRTDGSSYDILGNDTDVDGDDDELSLIHI